MIINENYRLCVKHRRQIIENYNMGFITPCELYCQLWDLYCWITTDERQYERRRKIWHLLCLLPSWVFSLYERVR